MRILFATLGLRLDGGISNLSISTLHVLESYASDVDNTHVDLISYADSTLELGESGGSWRYGARLSKVGYVVLHGMLRLIRKPDLVIYDSVSSARVSTLLGMSMAPYAVMVHDQIDLDPEARSDVCSILGGATHIIANSSRTAGIARAACPQPDPLLRSTIRVVNPAISPDRIDRWGRVDETALSQREPVVITVGRLDAEQAGKGHETLLRCWPAVRDVVPAARLLVVGDGTDRQRLEGIARAVEPANGVEFLGRVDDDQLGELLSSSVCFAMPSRQEGFGIVYAEAMWFGLPCIGSTADSASEVIDDGITGLLVPFGDEPRTAEAIITMLTDRDKAARLGAAGRTKCDAEYTPKAYRDRLLKALGLTSSPATRRMTDDYPGNP